MIRRWPTLLLALLFLCSPAVFGAEHVVPAAELEQSLQSVTETRRQNEAALLRLVDNEDVRRAATAAGIDPQQVRQAVPQLDDETLANLASRASELEQDVAGGVIGGVIIVLVLVLLLAVLIAVYVL